MRQSVQAGRATTNSLGQIADFTEDPPYNRLRFTDARSLIGNERGVLAQQSPVVPAGVGTTESAILRRSASFQAATGVSLRDMGSLNSSMP